MSSNSPNSSNPAATDAPKKTSVEPGSEANNWHITEADEKGFKLTDMIKKLLKPVFSKAIMFDEKEIHVLLTRVFKYYTSPPNKKTAPSASASATTSMSPPKPAANALLELQAPINICGDTHGQYNDLLRIFNACGAATKTQYLFLGDYVDRGGHSLEVIMLLFSLKLAMPRKMHLLRGNHELKAINKNYGFHAELKKRFQREEVYESVYNHFNQVFSYMPLCAIVSKRILCMHGGISPHLKSLDDIRAIPLPLETAKTHPLACDLLWADPEKDAKGFEPNKIRAISNVFGKKEVDDLCKRLDIDLIVRAHQVVEYGYAFFADRRLITVFSASRYQIELCNYAAVVVVNKMLELSFVQLKPEDFEVRRDECEENAKDQTTSNVPH
ncbi:Serine/threonine-protein phosphatase [Caenorhabditis elegans]|uniref:Serine/threonine-protein phosphatase n=1 Tax=Caenorhabditis elegans TaxID=6239 RepID=Q9XVD6_CAEEL|nr:Serine/threonine-protein phosphatase [Caenorhabditis elegans]CAB03908.1 Serine/threonine-protein phosphatase [Caenorhabditis elegans]|eukprot:NP_499528.1 Serine/threonine-protein phosphatase [Caenorhabditis elegans]